MKADEILAKIQTIFGVSKLELFAVALLLLGVVLAIPAQEVFRDKRIEPEVDNSVMAAMVNEWAEKNRTTYVGSNVEGEANPQLAAGDTVIEKESKFPKSKKKEAVPAGTKININTASKAELMRLPGVGDAMANKIIEYRSKTPFKEISDITKVKGIGEKKFEKMKPSINI